MPRGRPKKAQQSQSTVQNDAQQPIAEEDFFKTFSNTLMRALSGSYLYNPILQNQILKDINMTPQKYDRDSIKSMLANPSANEKQLKDLSQFLFNFIMQYKRIVYHFSEMLDFSWYLEPTNADEDDKKNKQFKKAFKKANEFMYELDAKLHFPNIVQDMILEDGKFYYLRESDNGYYLQEMPSDYCKIYNKTELGYQYAFNLTYFLRQGVNFDNFAPEFREYFNNFINGDDYSKYSNEFKENRYYYWQTLDPAKAWVFKFDQNHAGMSPPLQGLFLDAMEIVNYKDLLKTKTSLDVWRLLIAKIPIHKDGTGKSGNKKDDFAIAASTAGQFQQLMQSAVHQGVKVVATPLETEAIDLKNGESKESIIGIGNNEFWSSSGTWSGMFGEKKLTASGVEATVKTDEMFVTHLYRQFERFYNYQLKLRTGRYRFKVHLEGTKFDREERMSRAMEVLPYGAPFSYVATAMGKNIQEISNMLLLEDTLELREKITPWLTAHTQSGKGDVGAPKKKKVTDGGETTRDWDANDD